jgi:hypothetical protein
MIKIKLISRFDHFIGNGTQVHYAAGDVGEFDDKLAASLVYEGKGAPLSEDEQEEKSLDEPANKAKKAAPANKAKKADDAEQAE